MNQRRKKVGGQYLKANAEEIKNLMKEYHDAAKIPEVKKITTRSCPVCGKEIKKDKKYCSRQCFYNRNK